MIMWPHIISIFHNIEIWIAIRIMIADIYNKNKNETMLQMKIIICDVIVIFTCWWDVMRILLMRIMLEIPDHYRDTFRLSKSYSQTRIWRLQQTLAAYSIITYICFRILDSVEFMSISVKCRSIHDELRHVIHAK